MIDEYRLVVHPVALGAGERIFREPLTIIAPTSTAVFSGGAVAHVFAAQVTKMVRVRTRFSR